MALQGDPAAIRANNDRLLAMASKHPGMMPIATVHPYDGDAALAELQRVASKGVKVLKIHPHTQQFDAADVRVLALARRAGELGVIVLMDNASILPGDCERLFNLALQAPKTNFIFAHLGGMNFRFWNILAAARTPTTSISTSPRPSRWSPILRSRPNSSGPSATSASTTCYSARTFRSSRWRKI
jgi:predicted TIM-barrel fold metal-dependent hydrolase